MSDNKTPQFNINLKWFVIWILLIIGEPDILDGIIKLIHTKVKQFLNNQTEEIYEFIKEKIK